MYYCSRYFDSEKRPFSFVTEHDYHLEKHVYFEKDLAEVGRLLGGPQCGERPKDKDLALR